MPDHTMRCPYCSREIQLSETLSGQIEEKVKRDYEEKARQKELELKKREDDIKRRNAEIEGERRAIEETLARKLVVEKARLENEAQKKAREAVELKIKDLEEEKAEKEKQLAQAHKAELELRKRARELEEKEGRLDLEVARRIDNEREKIRQTAVEMFSEEHRLKDLDKDKKMADMQKMIDELKRKSEQGSMQAQGEVLELDLEALLRARFPVDVIEPVPKGVRGADVIQKIYTRTGIYCGSIAWESKRTKAWNDDWVTKLKDDQREIKAEAAVIVTEVLPKGVQGAFTQVEGIWVTGIPLAANLAEALRAGLIQLAQAKLSTAGKGEKMEAVYNYLSGSEFRHKIEAIAEAFKAMRDDLEHEKRAMIKIWAKREKQIERVVTNTMKMYGDMQGIMTLPEIKALELAPGQEAAEEA